MTTVQGELTRMIGVLAAQDAGVPYGVYRPEEHLEPDLRKKLLPLRDQIAEVGIPTTDVEATSVAARLAGMLGVAIPDMRTVAAAMIGRVAKKVIGPYEKGGKLAELRDRGFYLAEDEGEGTVDP